MSHYFTTRPLALKHGNKHDQKSDSDTHLTFHHIIPYYFNTIKL